MKEKLVHVSLPDKFKLNFGENCSSAVNKMLAIVADVEDKLIVDTIIKYATNNGFSDAYIIDEEFVKTALEKQIPKKPTIKKSYKVNCFTLMCPCCEMVLQADSPHCRHCGQALDWSTSDETFT